MSLTGRVGQHLFLSGFVTSAHKLLEGCFVIVINEDAENRPHLIAYIGVHMDAVILVYLLQTFYSVTL